MQKLNRMRFEPVGKLPSGQIDDRTSTARGTDTVGQWDKALTVWPEDMQAYWDMDSLTKRARLSDMKKHACNAGWALTVGPAGRVVPSGLVVVCTALPAV